MGEEDARNARACGGKCSVRELCGGKGGGLVLALVLRTSFHSRPPNERSLPRPFPEATSPYLMLSGRRTR